jgi:hypothetical protein
VLPWVFVGAGLLLVALLVGAPRDDSGEPFDPVSTAGTGTRGVVELVESFGADVDTGSNVPSAATDVALLFVDVLDEAQTGAVDAWVRDGGRLVVTDPFSSLAAPVQSSVGAFGITPQLPVERCDVASLQDLGVVDPGDAVRFEVADGDRSCFGDGGAAYVVVHEVGGGQIVSVGGGTAFTNEWLGRDDNAALAARLVVPEAGTRVSVLVPGVGEGSTDRSLGDVLAVGARLAMVQLVVAFGVYAWFRARRLGMPVIESQPVEIAGSELVVAVGQLLQQAKDPARAAALLRADARRRIAERLGLPVDVPIGVLVDAVVARTSVESEVAERALFDLPVRDDTALLVLAQDVHTVRQEVLHVG